MTVVFASPGFSERRIRRQPWAYVDRVARGLGERGFEVRILTDRRSTPVNGETLPYAIDERPQIVGPQTWLHGPADGLFQGLDAADVLVSFLGWPNIPAWPKAPGGTRQILAVSSPVFLNGEWRNLLESADTASGGLHLLISQLAALALRSGDFASFDGVVATSQAAHSFLSSRLEGKPLKNAPSGVDTDVLHYVRESRAGYQDPVVTYCGPPRRSRGLRVLLEAFRVLQKEFPRMRGQFLLRPDSAMDLRNVRWLAHGVSTLPAPDRVSVNSVPLGRDEFLRLLATTTVCAFPFQYSTSLTPLTLLEAMAMRIPAVVTPVGELPDVIGDEGGEVAKGPGPTEVAAALRQVLSRSGERSQSHLAPTPPTWDDVAGEWEDFLDSLT